MDRRKNLKTHKDTEIWKKYFDNDTLNPTGILKEGIYKLGNSSNNITDLETYLNDVIYHSTDNERKDYSELYNEMMEALLEFVSERMNKEVKEFDISKNAGTTGKTSGEVLLREAVEDFGAVSHSNSIERQTIENRMMLCENMLKELNNQENISQLATDIDKAKTILQNTIDAYNNFIQNAGDSKIEKKIMQVVKDAEGKVVKTKSGRAKRKDTGKRIEAYSVKGNKELKELLAIADAAYNSLVLIYDAHFNNNKDTGDLFEKILQAIGAINEDETVKSAFKKETEGNKYVSKNNDGFLHAELAIKYENEYKNYVGTKDNPKGSVQCQVGNDSTLTVDYDLIQNPFVQQQGKVDVTFTLPETSNKFKISAKNWANMDESYYGFGDTSLYNMLVRTVGMQKTIAYGLQTGWGERGSTKTNHIYYDNVSNYVKAITLLDALMGYGQKNSYADTIVINNRSESYVYVYSIKNILTDFLKTTDQQGLSIELDGKEYQEIGHEEDACIKKFYANKTRAKFFTTVTNGSINSMLRSLNSLKVKIRFNSLIKSLNK